MTDELRQKLTALGIPVKNHDPAALAAYFPPEFKIADFGLSQTDIAEVLLAFVDRGLIFLSGVSDDVAIQRSTRNHVCHFYKDRLEMVNMVSRFLEEGRRADEQCLWVLPSWLDPQTAESAMRIARGSFEYPEASDGLRLLRAADVYFDATASLKTANEIVHFWIEQDSMARTQGFSGLRITGDGTALAIDERWRSGVDYERLATERFEGKRITALCTYSLADVDPTRLAQVLSKHSCGFVRRNDTWDEIRTGAGVETAIEFLHALP